MREAVADGVKQQNEALELTAKDVREQNAYIARFDPSEMFGADGNLLHLKDMPKHVRCAIRSVEVLKRNLTSGDGAMDTTYKVQFWDKPKAIELEYKHFGLLIEQVNHTGTLKLTWQQ